MKPHRTDKVSLVFGLFFLAVTGWWLVAQRQDVALPAIGWFVAGGLILFGLLGLFGALRTARTEPATAPASGPPTSGPPASVSPAAVSPAPAPPVSSTPPGSPATAGDDPAPPEYR